MIGIQVTPENFTANVGYGANNLAIAINDAKRILAYMAPDTDEILATRHGLDVTEVNFIRGLYIAFGALVTDFEAITDANKVRGMGTTKQYVDL